MTDIYINAQKIQEVLDKATQRETRFEKALVCNRKQYGNKIFKFRHNEYFKSEKENKYKTAYLLLREKHRSLAG